LKFEANEKSYPKIKIKKLALALALARARDVDIDKPTSGCVVDNMSVA
jgi:hypothetical protein